MRVILGLLLLAASSFQEDPCYYCTLPGITSQSDPVCGDADASDLRLSMMMTADYATNSCYLTLWGCTYVDAVIDYTYQGQSGETCNFFPTLQFKPKCNGTFIVYADGILQIFKTFRCLM